MTNFEKIFGEISLQQAAAKSVYTMRTFRNATQKNV